MFDNNNLNDFSKYDDTFVTPFTKENKHATTRLIMKY